MVVAFNLNGPFTDGTDIYNAYQWSFQSQDLQLPEPSIGPEMGRDSVESNLEPSISCQRLCETLLVEVSHQNLWFLASLCLL